MPNRYTWVLLTVLVVVCLALVWADFTRNDASFSPRIVSPGPARSTAHDRPSHSPTPSASASASPSRGRSASARPSARSSATPSSRATRSPRPSSTPAPAPRTIELAATDYVAAPFETVHLSGRYLGGGGPTPLRVQQQLPSTGRWLTFPLPTTTDARGRFTAYVELGRTGRHLLRVVDPARNVVSATVTVEIQ